MICLLRKIHRLRKYPWISAQTMDPSIAQADPWISQIHRLHPTVILLSTAVGRNLWIGDIHGSACAIYGSILCAEIHGLQRYLWIELRGPWILRMIQYCWRRHVMDGLVISTNLKLNNFTHFNGPLQSTEQNQRPSASERLHGRRSRQVPAVILQLLRTSASHRTDTWGIVDQTYNANCPEILQLKLHNKHVCDNIAGGPANISRGPRKQLPWAIHRYLRNPWISAQSMDP